MTIRIQKHEVFFNVINSNSNYRDICLSLSNKYLLKVYKAWRKNPFKSFGKKVIILKTTEKEEKNIFGFAWKTFDVLMLQIKKEHYRKPRLKKSQDIIDNKLIEFNHYIQKSIFYELQEEIEETKSFSYETLKDAYKRLKNTL